MTQGKTIIVGFVFLTAILFVTNVKVLAADKSTCSLNQDKFDELKSIQNNPLSDYLEELNVRKALLLNTVNCAIEEAANLQMNLNSTATNDADVKKLASQLAGRLRDAIEYFEIQKSKVADLGLQGSRDFARNLKDWRDGNYKPAAKLSSNLIIWNRNQVILETAQNRITQVARTMNLLKLIDNEKIQGLFNDAQTNFKEALDYNQKAKDSLLRGFEAPDESLDAIKLTLESLAKTYQKFFDLNSLVNIAPSR